MILDEASTETPWKVWAIMEGQRQELGAYASEEEAKLAFEKLRPTLGPQTTGQSEEMAGGEGNLRRSGRRRSSPKRDLPPTPPAPAPVLGPPDAPSAAPVLTEQGSKSGPSKKRPATSSSSHRKRKRSSKYKGQ